MSVLRDAVQQSLDTVRESIKGLSPVNASEGILRIYCAAILFRQFESLDTISHLVHVKRGHAAPPLLRPSCEEYIWLTYLNRVPKEFVEDLLILVTELEKANLVLRQRRYEKTDRSESLDPNQSTQAWKLRSQFYQELDALGKKLEWETSAQTGRLPAVGWLAMKTDLSDVYDFVYAGTSRYVHFSGLELLRRTQDGEAEEQVIIESADYRDYWAAFSLYWGFTLFERTLNEAYKKTGLPLTWLDDEMWQTAVAHVQSLRKVPLIFSEEI